MVFGRKWAWFAKFSRARPTLRTPLHEILDPPLITNPPVSAISEVRLIPSAAHIIQEDRVDPGAKDATINVDCYCICKEYTAL